MKNVGNSKYPLIAILFVLLLSSCWEEGKPQPGDEDTGKFTKPNGIIDPAEARKAYVRYGERRLPLIKKYEDSIDRQGKEEKMPQKIKQNESKSTANNQEKQKFEPARFIHFKYDSIKKYLAYIEREAELSGEKIESLRIYFSNNPEQKEYSKGVEIVHPRQNSVMLSPTIKRNNEEFIFFTVDDAVDKRKAFTLSDDFIETEKGANSFDSQKDSKSKAGLMPNLFSSSANSPNPLFAANSTTYNRGSGSPPKSNN